jgi:hypothetical protein
MSRHRRCDARCVNAQPGSPCSCQCGGRNHAGAWQPDPTTGTPHPAPPGRWTPSRHQHEPNADQLTLTLA